MKYKSPLIVVTDLQASIAFYQSVLGLHVTMDFGSNVTLTGGLSLQTVESWMGFIQKNDIRFGGLDAELYFEEDDFDQFMAKLDQMDGITYVHPVVEQSWGQRCVRIFDPDQHIIEIGENIKAVCRRFLNQGMTQEQVAKRMDVPLKFVRACQKK